MGSNSRPKLCCPQPRSKEERDRARAMYEAGSSYREISETVGTPISTLRVWCKRLGWKLSKVESVIGTEAAAAEQIPDLPTLPEKQDYFSEKMADAAVRLAAHVDTLDGDQMVKAADKLLKATQTARANLKLDKQIPTVIQIGVLANSPAKLAQHRLVLEENKGLHSNVRPRQIEVGE